MRFRGANYEVKFDNLTLFKLAAAGLSPADLLISKNADAERFCRAHAIVCGLEFDGNAKAYLDGFGSSIDMFATNAEVLDALERDGIIAPDAEDEAQRA